jgi:hypothetical protein
VVINWLFDNQSLCITSSYYLQNVDNLIDIQFFDIDNLIGIDFFFLKQ